MDGQEKFNAILAKYPHPTRPHSEIEWPAWKKGQNDAMHDW